MNAATFITYRRAEHLLGYSGEFFGIALEPVWHVWINGVRVAFIVRGSPGEYFANVCVNSTYLCIGDTLNDCKSTLERVIIGAIEGAEHSVYRTSGQQKAFDILTDRLALVKPHAY